MPYAYLLSLVGGGFHHGFPLLSQSLAAAVRRRVKITDALLADGQHPDQEPGIDAARVFGEEVLVSLGGPAGNRRVRGRGEQPRFADR